MPASHLFELLHISTGPPKRTALLSFCAWNVDEPRTAQAMRHCSSPWTNRKKSLLGRGYVHTFTCIDFMYWEEIIEYFFEMIYHRNKIEFKLKISSSHFHIFLTIIDLPQWTFSLLECAVQKQKMLHRKWTPGAMKFMVTLLHLLLTQLVEDFYLV